MIYLFTAFVSLAVILILFGFNRQINIFDKPNDRSSHTRPIPRTGGVAIVTGLLLTLILFYPGYIGSLSIGAISWVFLVGLYDDIRSLNASKKFFFIVIAVVMLHLDGVTIPTLGQYFNWDMSLGWLSLPFALLFVGGLTNGMNLIDGLDGLAGGVAMVISLAFAYIGYKFGDSSILILASTLMVSLLPFLLLNRPPAKIFMGDSGSLSLGFIIAILSVLSVRHIHPVAILYLCAIPLIDTLVVMLRRIKKKQNPFSADKNHIHHILHGFFKSESLTVFFIILLQVLFCYIGYVVARQIELYPAGLLPLATVVSFTILILLCYIVFTTILNNQKQGVKSDHD